MTAPANDNPPAARPIHLVPIVGFVGAHGQVTITDPDWRPAPHPAAPPIFPKDPRET